MSVSSGLLGVGVLGAVGGAALDQIHVQTGVLAYPHPTFFDQSWWVAPQFGVAVLVILVAAKPLARAAAKRAPRPEPAQVAAEAVWFLGAYAASGVFGNRHPVGLAVVYGATWLVRLAGRADRLVVAATSLALAAGGVLYEGTLAATGAFHYTHADVHHVPVWLAGIYLHGAPLLLAVGRQLSEPVIRASRRAGSPVEPRR